MAQRTAGDIGPQDARKPDGDRDMRTVNQRLLRLGAQ